MPLLDDKVKTLPGARNVLALCFGIALLNALFIAGEAIFLSKAISQLWLGKELVAQMPWIALFAACLVARAATTYVRDTKTDSFARQTCVSLRTQALLSLFDSGTGAVLQRGSGSVVSTLVEGIKQIHTYLALIVPKVADLMVIPFVLSCVLTALDPISGIICLAMLPCIVFYMRMLGSHAKEQATQQLGTYQQLANHFTDSLRGVATLKVFGAGKRFAETVYERSERLRIATTHVLRTATLSSLVLDLFRVFALAAVAIMLGFRLMDGSVQLMPALTVLIAVPELFAVVRRYSADFHASLDGRNQLNAVLEIIHQQTAHDLTPYPLMPSPPTIALRSVSFSYELKAEAVRTQTPQSTASNHAQALSNLSFDCAGPLRVGIVGVSGSGKSTLAHVLAGFAQPTSGSVSVNGTEGASLDCPSWQQRVIYLPQDPHIFSATLRENVAFYQPNAHDDEIMRALHSAGLDTTFSQLSDGLDTLIGDGGRGLSGGQAHRVALARAFLDTSRDVLVFDEPTAHLDIETELDIKQNILALMEGRLVFFATHRLHWLNDMDVVLVLDHGRLVQMGAPADLLKTGGALQKLVNELNGGVAL